MRPSIATWPDNDNSSPPCQRPSKTFLPRSGEVEAIEVHHLVPGRGEVVDELLLRVGASVDFSQGAELRVRAKDQVDTCAGPLQFTRFGIAAFEHVCVFRD